MSDETKQQLHDRLMAGANAINERFDLETIVDELKLALFDSPLMDPGKIDPTTIVPISRLTDVGSTPIFVDPNQMEGINYPQRSPAFVSVKPFSQDGKVGISVDTQRIMFEEKDGVTKPIVIGGYDLARSDGSAEQTVNRNRSLTDARNGNTRQVTFDSVVFPYMQSAHGNLVVRKVGNFVGIQVIGQGTATAIPKIA